MKKAEECRNRMRVEVRRVIIIIIIMINYDQKRME